MYSFECALCKTITLHDDDSVYQQSRYGLAMFCDNHTVTEDQEGTVFIDGIDQSTF